MLRRVGFSLVKSSLFWCAFVFGSAAYFVYLKSDSFLKSRDHSFCVKKVIFEGNEKVSEILLLKMSSIRYKNNIFAFSINDVKKRLENISWVRSVMVQRRLPDTVYIRISERTPKAMMRTDGKWYLVDADGVILENDGMGDLDNLLVIEGDGAAKDIARFSEILDRHPKIRNQMVRAMIIGKRRWNIRINKGLLVKLPEKRDSQAMDVLEELADSGGFFNDDISVIDLRLSDRVIITKQHRDSETSMLNKSLVQ